MSECRYHRLYRKTLRSSDTLLYDPAALEVEAQWCAHSQARVGSPGTELEFAL